MLEDPTYDPAAPWRWRAPGGESLLDVKARIAPHVDQLLQVTAGDIVLVSHAGTMQALCAHVTGSWRRTLSHNAGIVVVERTAAGCRLVEDDSDRP